MASNNGNEDKRIQWEYENNQHWISVYDEILCINISVEVDFLIAPFDFANGQANNNLRLWAIEQHAFKPYTGPLI